MAYINREQVCENCNNKNCCEKEKCPVYKVSTADVVPKSEVVAMMQWVELLKTQLAEAKQEVAREIFEEIHQEIKLALANNRKRLSECEFADDWQSYISGKLDALRGLDDFIDTLEEKHLGKDINIPTNTKD